MIQTSPGPEKSPSFHARKLAVDALFDALQRTPMTQWKTVIEQAMVSTHQLGYSEGVKAERAMKPTPEAPVPTAPATQAPVSMEGGEDRALSNEKPGPDEAVKDLGYQFLGEIARQLGNIAIEHELNPGHVYVAIHPFRDQDNILKVRAEIQLDQPKMKGR